MKTLKTLTQADIKQAIAAFTGATADNVVLSIDRGDPGHYADTGPTVSATAEIDDAKPAAPQAGIWAGTCAKELAKAGKPYPRTCPTCQLGPCKKGL